MEKSKLDSIEKCFLATGRDIKNLPSVDLLPEKDKNHVVDSYKMNVVIDAINGGIDPDWGNDNEQKHRIWVDVEADASKPSGFRLSFLGGRDTGTSTIVPSCLTFRSDEGAEFFVENYLELMEAVYLPKR